MAKTKHQDEKPKGLVQKALDAVDHAIHPHSNDHELDHQDQLQDADKDQDADQKQVEHKNESPKGLRKFDKFKTGENLND